MCCPGVGGCQIGHRPWGVEFLEWRSEEMWPCGGILVLSVLDRRQTAATADRQRLEPRETRLVGEKDPSMSLPSYVEPRYAEKGYAWKARATHTSDARMLHRSLVPPPPPDRP